MPGMTMHADRLEAGAGAAAHHGQQTALPNTGENFDQEQA